MKEILIDFKRFLNLLCSGLYEEDLDLPLFISGRVDWELIFRYSQEQTVCGIVFDGINKLPSELRPSRTIYLKWCSLAARIEALNEEMNRALHSLLDIFEEQQIPVVLLKGQGAASRYSNPLRRLCGDIDLYVSLAYMPRVEELLAEYRLVLYEVGYEKHAEYNWHGVVVEMHFFIVRFYYPVLDRKFRRLVDLWYPNGTGSVEVAGRKVLVPPTTFDVFYMLVHIYEHILFGGVGLRQFCDWVLLLRHSKDKIDKEELANYLKSFHFARVYGAIAYIAVTYLQLPASDLPIALRKSDKAYGEQVMRIVMAGGNFGKYDEEGVPEAKSDLLSQLGNFWRVCRSCYRLFLFCPAESIWFPIQKVRFYLKKRSTEE